MPINFPTNPSSGDTYDYGGIHYIYNGDGWVNKSIYGVSAGNQISFNNYNGTGPVRIDVVEGIGSGLDADLLQGVSGQRFVENLQTGLLYGGLLQVNAGNSAYFDITSGVGIISAAGASLTAYPVPSFNYVTWGALSGLTVAGITSDEETWVSINSAGNVVQQNTKWTDSQFDDSIPLGVLIHPNNTSINFAVDIPHVAYGQPSQLDPFVRAFGPIKISGHEISANGANLQVNKSTGSAYLIGRNYSTNPNSPNVVEDTNATPITTIYRYYRDGSGKFTVVTNSSIDPTKWDDGTGVLNSVAGGQYTIQRLFFLPGEPSVLAAYYGRETYNSIQTAQANIPFEQFNEDDSTASLGVFAGYLIVKGSTTQLNNTSDAKFINSGIFRNLSNIGGGGVAATSLDDLSDVTITSVVTGQVLKYNGGFWENDYVSNLDLVSSFNGKTGAIQGVSAAVAGSGISVSGATGSVTITNTGVLSFNGKTGAIQGVSSINGSTGAITNVAFTNVNNNFSANQTISAANAYLSIVDSSSLNEVSFEGEFSRLYFYNDLSGGEVFFQPTIAPASTITVSLPDFTTILAGLAGTQTFTGSKTFSSQANFSAGISASGATFNGNIVLQNNEIIRNTTNGRIDLMPAPTGTTHFGIYFDTTGWGFGTQIGTIRSSDGLLNTGGSILWNSPLVVAADTNFVFGSNSAYRMRNSSTGNDTLQIALAGGAYTSTNSNSLALVDVNGLGNANRSPGTTHANPNLYIYANGNASANDFMRLEHGRTAGLIQTGGTSGLTLAPGSGILGISGSFTASGATFSGNISAPNIVNNFGGATGGITFGGYMLTWGGLTSSYDILPLGYNSMSAPIGTLPIVNNAYFCPIFINRNVKIKTIGHQTGTSASGNTGQMIFGLYSSDNYGYPETKLYNSAGITLSTSNFAVQRATVDVDVGPGLYWLALIWSAIGSGTGGYGRIGGRTVTLTSTTATSPIGQTTTHCIRRNMGGFTLTNLSGATFTDVTGNDPVCLFYTSEYRA